jgi:hypothetical protein
MYIEEVYLRFAASRMEMYPGSSSFSILKELVHLYTEAEMSAGSAEPRRRPYEGRGQSAIVIGEIGKKLIAHMMEREDRASYEEHTCQQMEPSVGLVPPGCVRGSGRHHHPMGRIVHKGRACR